jgi:hypothetical protein
MSKANFLEKLLDGAEVEWNYPFSYECLRPYKNQ